MQLDNFPKVLWINLNHSIKRREYMEKLLNEHNLENTRIEAVNGFNPIELNAKCIPNKNYTSGENACTVSHMMAMQYFVNNIDDDSIVIFEDDVSFDFLSLIPFNWSNLITKLPIDCDVVQLAVTHETSITPDLVRNLPTLKYYGSVAYLINKSAANQILKQYLDATTNLIDLSNKIHVTADSIITNTVTTYSIPIFTYKTSDSIIHPNHLYIHQRAKSEQLHMWKNFNYV